MRKYLIISLLASYSIVFAGESEDFKAVDNLYKERNFKAALVESEKFLQKGKGIILNICSTGALYQHPYMAVYSSAKSALLHYSLALDEELAHKNKDVRVLSVCPGPTESNFFDKNTQEKFGSSQKFMMSSEETAKKIIKAMEKGRRFSIIGFRNRVSMFLINLLPISLQLRLAGLVLKKVIK